MWVGEEGAEVGGYVGGGVEFEAEAFEGEDFGRGRGHFVGVGGCGGLCVEMSSGFGVWWWEMENAMFTVSLVGLTVANQSCLSLDHYKSTP